MILTEQEHSCVVSSLKRLMTGSRPSCQEGYEEELAEQLPDGWLYYFNLSRAWMVGWKMVEAEILARGQHCLPDILDTFVDGVAERLIDDKYAKMIEDFPRQQTLRQIAHLEAKQKILQVDSQMPFPHRQPKRGTANATEKAAHSAKVPSVFEAQEGFFAQISKACWLDLPKSASLAPSEGGKGLRDRTPFQWEEAGW
jgi:hypothetical protein